MVESMNDPSRSCGAALPVDAAFRGTCESKVAGAGGCEVSAEANPLRKLLAVIWASIGIDVLSCLIGVVDVREYYELGRFMYAVNEVCSIALSAWLAIGITNRKNWARVTFIVYGLLCLSATFLCYFGLEQGGGGNAWVPFLDTANLALIVYCVAMLFTKKVSGLFFKSTNGKKWAWAFWGVFFVYLVFMVVGSWDHESSDEYYRDCAKAAEQGNAKARYNLFGYCYYDIGEGVRKDTAEGVRWYRKAAEKGYVWAQYNLGDCYYNGKGVDKDMKEAAKWWYKAAEQGYAKAQYKLGVCYHYGEGVPKDMKEAILWLERAKEQGNQDAIDLLAEIGSK